MNYLKEGDAESYNENIVDYFKFNINRATFHFNNNKNEIDFSFLKSAFRN